MFDPKLPMEADRRKNPARKSAAVDVAYQVLPNPSRRTYEVRRDGVKTGGFAHDKDTAIGLAIREAEIDKAEGRKAIVYSTLDGKAKVEWPTESL